MYPENCLRGMSKAKMILTDPQGDKYTLETTDFDYFGNLHMKNLIKGEYSIAVSARWGPNDVKDYTLRIYSK